MQMLMRRGSQAIGQARERRQVAATANRERRRLSVYTSVGTHIENLRDLFMPDSKSRVRWELVVMLLLIVQLVLCPYVMAFELLPEHLSETDQKAGTVAYLRLVTDSLTDLVLVADMWVRMCSYFFDVHGDLIVERATTQRRYTHSAAPAHSFVLDAAITVAGLSETVVLLATGSLWSAALWCRWGVLLRLPRVLGSFSLLLRGAMYHYHMSPNLYAIIRLVSLFALLLLCAHWVACVYHGLHIVTDAYGYEAMMERDGMGQKPYPYAMYMAMVMLLGNEHPSVSRVFSVAILTLGSALFATIFGNMTVLLSNHGASTRAFQDKVEAVKQRLALMEVDQALESRIMKYYQYMWRRSSHIGVDSFLDELPVSLRTDVRIHLHQQLVEKVPFFQNTENSFLMDVISKLQSVIYGPGDNIIVEGDAGREMYFIEAGEVQVIITVEDVNQVVASLSSGEFFGEIALLHQQSRRGASVVATTFCDIQMLEKKDFDTIMEDWPEYLPRIKTVASNRQGMNEDMLKKTRGVSGSGAAMFKALAQETQPAYTVRRRKRSKFKSAGKAVLASKRFQGLMSGLGGRASPGGTVTGTEEEQAASPASSPGSAEAASLPGQLPLSPLTYGDGSTGPRSRSRSMSLGEHDLKLRSRGGQPSTQAKMAAAKQSSLRPSSSREGSIAMALEVAGGSSRRRLNSRGHSGASPKMATFDDSSNNDFSGMSPSPGAKNDFSGMSPTPGQAKFVVRRRAKTDGHLLDSEVNDVLTSILDGDGSFNEGTEEREGKQEPGSSATNQAGAQRKQAFLPEQLELLLSSPLPKEDDDTGGAVPPSPAPFRKRAVSKSGREPVHPGDIRARRRNSLPDSSSPADDEAAAAVHAGADGASSVRFDALAADVEQLGKKLELMVHGQNEVLRLLRERPQLREEVGEHMPG